MYIHISYMYNVNVRRRRCRLVSARVYSHPEARVALIHCFLDSEDSLWSGWNFPPWCSGGRGPLIAGCIPPEAWSELFRASRMTNGMIVASAEICGDCHFPL